MTTNRPPIQRMFSVNAGSASFNAPDQFELGDYKLLQRQRKVVRGPGFFSPQSPVIPGFNRVFTMIVLTPGDSEPTESELVESNKKSGKSNAGSARCLE